jgi:hypothetical protein
LIQKIGRNMKNRRQGRILITNSIAGDDLTGLFWTKLCEKLSLERSFGYAEEEIQRGANRGGASSD